MPDVGIRVELEGIEKARQGVDDLDNSLDKLAAHRLDGLTTAIDNSEVKKGLAEVQASIDQIAEQAPEIHFVAEVGLAQRNIAAVNDSLDELDSRIVEASVLVDSSAVRNEVDRVNDLLDEVADHSAQVTVTADVREAERQLERVTGTLDDLTGSSAEVTVTADTSDVDTVNNLLDDLDARRPEVDIIVNADEAQDVLTELDTALREVGSGRGTDRQIELSREFFDAIAEGAIAAGASVEESTEIQKRALEHLINANQGVGRSLSEVEDATKRSSDESRKASDQLEEQIVSVTRLGQAYAQMYSQLEQGRSFTPDASTLPVQEAPRESSAFSVGNLAQLSTTAQLSTVQEQMARNAQDALMSGASAGDVVEIQKRFLEEVMTANTRVIDSLGEVQSSNDDLKRSLDEVNEATGRVSESTRTLIEDHSKEAEKLREVTVAYNKYTASRMPALGSTEAGLPILLDPQGRSLAPPKPQGRLNGNEDVVEPTTLQESIEATKAQRKEMIQGHEDMRRAESGTQALSQSTAELNKELQSLESRYDPLGAKLRKLTADQEHYDAILNKARSAGMNVSGRSAEIGKGIDDEIEKTKKAIEAQASGADGAKDANDGLSASLANLALRYIAPVAIIQQLYSVFMQSAEAGREAALANVRLEAVLDATGQAAGRSGTQIDKMAEALQQTTGIDSEKIKQASTNLLTYTSIYGDMHDKVLKLSTDLSRLKGIGVEQASNLLGRAITDDSASLGGLSRYIGQATDVQKRYLEDVKLTGDALALQAAKVEILSGKFGDLAEKMGKSPALNPERLSNSWSELLKAISRTGDDPTGGGGRVSGFLSAAIDEATKKLKEYNEVEIRGMMAYYKADSENMELSFEDRKTAAAKYEEYRRALGIQTEKEIAAAAIESEQVKTQRVIENDNRRRKAEQDRALKNIDAEIALQRKTPQDKLSILARQAIDTPNYNADERLQKEAAMLAVRKEISSVTLQMVNDEVTLGGKTLEQKIEQLRIMQQMKVENPYDTTDPEIRRYQKTPPPAKSMYNPQELSSLAVQELTAAKELISIDAQHGREMNSLMQVQAQGEQELISLRLAFGNISKEQAEEAKMNLALSLNMEQLISNEKWVQATRQKGMDKEHLSALAEQEKLKLQRVNIAISGQSAIDQAVEEKRKKGIEDETKTTKELFDIREKADKANSDASTGFFMAQSEKIKKMELEISLQGQSDTQKAIALGLYDLEQERLRAIGRLQIEGASNYIEALKQINDQFANSADKLPDLISANKKATDEVTEFWRKAAEEIQSAMGDFLFDAMQGKFENFADRFKTTIDRMVANALAAKLNTELFGEEFPKNGGKIGGWIGLGIDKLKGNTTQAPAKVVDKSTPALPEDIARIGSLESNTAQAAAATELEVSITALSTEADVLAASITPLTAEIDIQAASMTASNAVLEALGITVPTVDSALVSLATSALPAEGALAALTTAAVEAAVALQAITASTAVDKGGDLLGAATAGGGGLLSMLTGGGGMDAAVGDAINNDLLAGFAEAATSLPFAKGAVFNKGIMPTPFGKGDVFSSPNTFPMAHGETGILAEAGPEAVMPLTRGPGGRLGVTSTGATRTDRNIVINITQNLPNTDRRSASQSATMAASAVQRELTRHS